MKSSRPYLVRALYEWIADNGCTPYILVDANNPQVQVPREFVKEGKIILNIGFGAVKDLSFIDAVSFNARFSGRAQDIFVPFPAVHAIYAKENGQGMVFGPEEDEPISATEPDETPPHSPKTKPSLKVVK